MEMYLNVVVAISVTVWAVFGMFVFYTTVRDDIRSEKECKEKKQ